jgi:hypothetical protein
VSEVHIHITVQLSEKMEDSIERLIDVLTTAQHRWEDDNDDQYEDDDTD